jgi:hypothetical protein
MKFTKDQALQNLKAQFSAKGENLKLSDRTLSETIETLMPALTTDDTEIDSFIKVLYPVVKTTNGNFIKETTDHVKSWEEAHPEKKKPEEKPSNGQFDPDAIGKMISEQFEKFAMPIIADVNKIKAQDRNSQLIKSATNIFMTKKPDPKWKAAYEDAIDLVSAKISDSDTPESLSLAIEERFNKNVAIAGAKSGYIPAKSNDNDPEENKSKNGFVVKTLENAGLIPKSESK